MLIFLSMLETDDERREFLELYNRYGTAMLRVAQRYFPNDSHTVEDAVQNAWLKAVENFSKILSVDCKKRGAYLVIIVKNESISMLRKRHPEQPFDEAFANKQSNLGDRGAASVAELIQTMPDTYRAVLEMRFVEERSTREIAKTLRLKETTVNTRIHRGRAMLIEKLKEEGYGE